MQFHNTLSSLSSNSSQFYNLAQKKFNSNSQISQMLPQTQSLSSNLPFPVLPYTNFPKPSSLSFSKFFQNKSRKNSSCLKCSVSLVSDKTQLELPKKHKPLPSEVSRTIMELSSVGTLSTLTQDGWPLGNGVRFAVDGNGTPVLCLNEFDGTLCVDKRCSLHVKLEQFGVRTPQCTILGKLEKPSDLTALKRLCSAWNKRFNEDVEESLIHVVNVERLLQIENFSEGGVWVNSLEYGSADPDPLRECAGKIVHEINTHNAEDVLRFCNIYVDFDFQVLDAKMVWVDRLGFDVHVKSVQKYVYEVRIPFPREVADEKGAKSSFNGMSQLAWEVEKNFAAPDFSKATHMKKII